MSKLEVEIYALSQLKEALRRLVDNLPSALQDAQSAVTNEKQRLAQIQRQREMVVTACRAALAACESSSDEDGHRRDCSPEQTALEEAQQSLREIVQHMKRFDDQTQAVLWQASRAQEATIEHGTSARENLDLHIWAGLEYLRVHPEALGSVPGAGTHGQLYQDARREWFAQGAAGELTWESLAAQNWMRRQVQQGGHYLRSYPGYHTSHYVAGVDIAENFSWDLAANNIQRYHTARRQGLPRTQY